GAAGRDDARAPDVAGDYSRDNESGRERIPPSCSRTWTLWGGIVSNSCGSGISGTGSTCRLDPALAFPSARVLDHGLDQRWSRALLLVDQPAGPPASVRADSKR